MAIIYALTCINTGYSYIGCTSGKLAKRMREHRCLLNQKRHAELLMQEHWTKYGSDSFQITIIERLPDDADVKIKRAAELKWMAAYGEAEKLYNTHIVSFCLPRHGVLKGIEASRHVEGNKRSPEANLKRSLAQLGKPKGHGAKISATKQAQKHERIDRTMSELFDKLTANMRRND